MKNSNPDLAYFAPDGRTVRRSIGPLYALICGVLSVALWTMPALAQSPKPNDKRPISRVDRMWIVGSPVLKVEGEQTPPGLYVWIEDGAVQLAAVAPANGVGVFRVQVRPTEILKDSDLGDFKKVNVGKRRAPSIVLEARVSSGVARGKIVTFGEVSISRATLGNRSAKVYLGPMRKRAGSKVWIGPT